MFPVFQDSPVFVAAHVLGRVEKDATLVLCVAELALGVFRGTPSIEVSHVATFEVDGVGRVTVVDSCPEALLVTEREKTDMKLWKMEVGQKQYLGQHN